MIIGFTVNDPRLSFPPKNAHPNPDFGPSSTPILQSSLLAQSTLWDASARRKPRYTKKELDERRSKNLVPGTKLTPLRQDDRVPVILIQRSLESFSNSIGNNEGAGLHGWTLLIPSSWSMAFLPSLIFTGTRVGGQRERHVQAFEAGTCNFPRDYPCTEAYEGEEEKMSSEEKEKWERTPPAKRVNYKKLGTRSPWRADWEVVLGLEASKEGDEEEEEELVTTQRPEIQEGGGGGDEGDEVEARDENEDEEMNVDASPKIQPWLLTGSDVSSLVSSLSSRPNEKQAEALLAHVNERRTMRSLGELSLAGVNKTETLLKSALVNVKIYMHSKGAPGDLAMIYKIPDEELGEWREVISRNPDAVGDNGMKNIEEVCRLNLACT